MNVELKFLYNLLFCKLCVWYPVTSAASIQQQAGLEYVGEPQKSTLIV